MVVFTGCASFSNVRVTNPQSGEDLNFVVEGNGTIAVQYGPYVYFINGTANDFTNEDGSRNRWGSVVQGGIYRARLTGSARGGAGADGTLNQWIPQVHDSVHEESSNVFSFVQVPADDDRSLTFGVRPDIGEDYEEHEALKERSDIMDTVQIAPVAVGTASGGGIFIFNQHIFFATPNTQLNREGEVQYNHTDFMMMRLDGGGVTRLFTSRGDTSGLPFAFHYMGESVYLVAASHNDNGLVDIVSVRIRIRSGSSNARVSSPNYITREAQAENVHLPVRRNFDRTDNSVGLEDFIFYTRAVDRVKDHPQTQGNVISITRPDGSEGFTYQTDGHNTSIEQVNDGAIFYTRTNPDDDSEYIVFNNLHDALMENSPTYAAYFNGLTDAERAFRGGQQHNIVYNWAHTPFAETFHERYFFRGHGNNDGFMLGFTEDRIEKISYSVDGFQLGMSTPLVQDHDVELLFVHGGYVYYWSDSSIFRVSLAGGEMPVLLVNGWAMHAGGGQRAAYVAGYLMFFGGQTHQGSQWITEGTGYSFIVHTRRAGAEPFFIGTVDERDLPTDEELRQHLRILDGEYVPEEEVEEG